MGLRRLRFAHWVCCYLNDLDDFLNRTRDRIRKWGTEGYRNCPICGSKCHMSNIVIDDGLCIECSPTPEFLRREDEPVDAHVLPYGDTYVIKANNDEMHHILNHFCEIFNGMRLQGDGTLFPAHPDQLHTIIKYMRGKGHEVELKVF